MRPDDEDVTVDEYGAEIHPSFGWAQVNRAHIGPKGTPLFDSELLHREVVTLRLGRARRKRDLQRDWIHGDESIVEVRMSMAQWGALVSSFSSSGVPVTIDRLGMEMIPNPPYAPRLASSTAEVEGATAKLVGELEDAVSALRDAYDSKAGRKEMEERLRSVEIHLGNARANARFTAESFTEHVENVVTKAKADVEAMVQMAADRQLEAPLGMAELLGGSDEPLDG